jgi:hypothetical protein
LLLGRGGALRRAGVLIAGFFIFSLATFLADLLAAALDFARFAFFRVTMLRSVHSVHAREAGIKCFVSSRLAPRLRFRGDERLVHRPYFLRRALCGLRLPMRPLSLPADGSITALTRVGLPESIASFTARLSSSGDVALTPMPSNASIILS